MSRPNPPRPLAGELRVAERVKYERERRNMTYEGLAQRMTDAGCAIQPSGIYKIEKQGRRVTVEEMVALAIAFDIEPADMLLPLAAVVSEQARAVIEDFAQAVADLRRATEALRSASTGMLTVMQSDLRTVVELFAEAEGQLANGQLPKGIRNLLIHMIAAMEKSDHDIERASKITTRLFIDAALSSIDMDLTEDDGVED